MKPLYGFHLNMFQTNWRKLVKPYQKAEGILSKLPTVSCALTHAGLLDDLTGTINPYSLFLQLFFFLSS